MQREICFYVILISCEEVAILEDSWKLSLRDWLTSIAMNARTSRTRHGANLMLQQTKVIIHILLSHLSFALYRLLEV